MPSAKQILKLLEAELADADRWLIAQVLEAKETELPLFLLVAVKNRAEKALRLERAKGNVVS